MPHAQAVGDEQDDILGDGLFGRAVHVPPGGGGAGRALRRHLVRAGLERNAAQDKRGGVDALFLGDEFRLPAEHRLGVLSVDEDLGVLLRDHAVEFHLEVEPASPQKAGGVHRIDVRRGLRGAGKDHDPQQGGNETAFHEFSLVQ